MIKKFSSPKIKIWFEPIRASPELQRGEYFSSSSFTVSPIN